MWTHNWLVVNMEVKCMYLYMFVHLSFCIYMQNQDTTWTIICLSNVEVQATDAKLTCFLSEDQINYLPTQPNPTFVNILWIFYSFSRWYMQAFVMFMGMLGCPWIAMDILGCQWMPIDVHGSVTILLDAIGHPLMPMNIHGFLGMSTRSHWWRWKPMYANRYSSNSIHQGPGQNSRVQAVPLRAKDWD